MVQRPLEKTFGHYVRREQAYVRRLYIIRLIRNLYAFSDRFSGLKPVANRHVLVCDDEIVDVFTSVEAPLD